MKRELFNILFLLPLFLLINTFSSCKKDDGLPNATQTGAGIMAAKVNGKVWNATPCWTCIGGGGGIKAVYGTTNIILAGEQLNDNTNLTIEFSVVKVANQMVYTLNSENSNSARLSDHKSQKTYYTSPSSTGTVTFTKIDTINKIISGTFSFKAGNESDPSDIIEVTDGRFDVKY